jgi:hypothetical protein
VFAGTGEPSALLNHPGAIPETPNAVFPELWNVAEAAPPIVLTLPYERGPRFTDAVSRVIDLSDARYIYDVLTLVALKFSSEVATHWMLMLWPCGI